MSVATLSESPRGLDGDKMARLVEPWRRPTDWPALPPVNVGDQKMVALHAVYDHDSNFCALTFSVAASNASVDWGDGSAPETFATTAQHVYDFNDPDLGPVTSEGFKIAVITVVPNGANNLTTVTLNVRHATANVVYNAGWLDIKLAGRFISALNINTTLVANRSLRQFEFVGGPGSMHAIPAASFTSMFNGCGGLENVILPRAFTTGATNLTGMFQSCAVLRTIPPLDIAATQNVSTMFNNCPSLVTVPPLDTGQCTNFSNMFQGCGSLESIPLLDTSKGTLFSSMFSGCTALKAIPPLDTHLGTTFSSMFASCGALKAIPPLDLHLGTNLANMINGCSCLIILPNLTTPAATNFTNFASNCAALQVTGTLDMSAALTGQTGAFSGCTSLSKSGVSGCKFAITFTGKLSGPELNRIYTNLGVASAQTINVTGNYGTTADDPTIATAKGWTVTGS